MARIKTAILLKRAERAKQLKAPWLDMLSEAYEYALPQRNLYFAGAENDPAAGAGQKKSSRVFDSTALNSAISFANRIQSDMMPPFQRWMKLEAGPLAPKAQRAKINRLLELVTDQFFAVLQASNFDTSNNEVLLDLSVGTGCMLALEGEPSRPVMFMAVPAPQVYLDEGAWGTVGGVYRFHSLEARNIDTQWSDAKMSEELKKIATDPDKGDERIPLVEVTYFDKVENKWRYEVIWPKRSQVVVERTYHENPWITPRWIKVAGEPYGRGPVIQALPDIKTINKLVELILKNAALHVSGIYTGVDDGVLNPNTVKMRPGVVIPVASNGGTRGPSLQSLERTGSFDVAMLQHEKLQMSIRQMLLDNRLPAESGAVRSATEIIERIKELARDIGSPFSRLMQEYIVPVVQRTLNIMARRGLIPDVKIDGLVVQVRVVSPLAQEQNINDVATVVRWLTILSSLGPEIVHLAAKTEDVGDWMGDKLGVPSALRRTADERTALQKQIGTMMGARAAGTQGIPVGAGQNPGLVTTAANAAEVLPLAA